MNEHLFRGPCIGNARRRRNRWPFDKDGREGKPAGGRELGIARRAATVLSDDQFDAMPAEKFDFTIFIEGTAGQNIGRVRHAERRIDRIDTSDQIAVPRRLGQRPQFLAPEGHQYTPGIRARTTHGIGHRFGLGPMVPGYGLPGGTSYGEELYARRRRRVDGIFRYHVRERMGCVDHDFGFAGTEITGEAPRSAKAADPDGDGLREWMRGPARKRKRDVEIVEIANRSRELARLERTAENEDTVGHGRF